MGIKFLYGVTVNGDSTFTDNIGVGTLTPSSKVQVIGTVRATGVSGNVDVDPANGALRFYDGVLFHGGLYNDSTVSGGLASDLHMNAAVGNFFISTENVAKAVTVQGSTGNVGLNTTDPQATLHVNGTLRVDNQGVGPISIPPQPDMWITINVNGSDYVVPAYLPGP